MQSGQVNASQLLAAFLGHVKGKLGKAITKNDFTGELEKHMPKQLTSAGTPELEEAGAAKSDESNADSKDSATGAAVSSETKSGASLLVKDKGLTDASAKIKEIKSKAKAEKSLFVTNTAIVQTILADLHYPAKVRDACEKLLSKKGHLSLQDLRSILNTQPDGDAGTASGVPAAAVRTLVESIVKASGNAEGKATAAERSLNAPVGIKPDGTYTRNELRDLLEKVVQAAQKTSTQTKTSSSSSSSATSTAATQTVESLTTGQTAELVSTVIPSFASAGRKVTGESALAEEATAGKTAGSQSAHGKAADLGEHLLKADSSGSNSPGHVGSAKGGSSSGDGEATASSTQTVVQGGEKGASKTTAATGSASAQAAHTDMTAAGLEAAAELADRIKAGGSREISDSGSKAAATGTDSLKNVESRARQGGQETSMMGKQIEKLAGGKDQPAENGGLQSAAASSDDNLINVSQMNNSSGNGFVSQDRDRRAEPVQKTRGAKASGASTTGASDQNIATILASYISALEGTGRAAGNSSESADNKKSDLQGSKKKDSSDNSAPGVSNSGKTGKQAVSDKSAQVSGQGDATGGSSEAGTQGAGSGSSSASASAWSLAQQTAVNMPAGAVDQDTQSGDEQSSDSSFEKNAAEGISATTRTDTLTSMQQLVLGRQGIVVAAKRIDEQSNAGKGLSPDIAALQASAAHLQATNPQPAASAAQNGFPMYDPSGGAELAESMLGQMGGGIGNQLVLEMDSDGLGKINLKVGAKKDQISVEALTQNEPARQALMSNSVGLRQDLRDQGLVLGKFMVDVSGGQAGGESNAEANQSGGKGRRAPRAATKAAARTVKASEVEAPVRASSMTLRSQISIFA